MEYRRDRDPARRSAGDCFYLFETARAQRAQGIFGAGSGIAVPHEKKVHARISAEAVREQAREIRRRCIESMRVL
jgi:hypothetical protein